MTKKLGIDLGTNSIGLAIRNENQFDWFGVYTFKKGVGKDKSGEYSFAAERTKHRATRRLYNARRYRKWETLKVLIENKLCPLTINELNNWKHYTKGKGRIYPLNNDKFNNWIKLDFNNDEKPDFTSPYQLRKLLIEEKLDLTKQENKLKVGRALYHIAQRRGFKSSRKNGDKEKSSVYSGANSTKTIGVNKYSELIEKQGSLGAAFAYLENNGLRIRNRYTLRKHYLNEVEKILNFQELEENIKEPIIKSIFYQRPLRSQKGLIGKCPFEKNKYRCPISHPKFEEFRMYSFINSIKIKTPNDDKLRRLTNEEKEEIIPLFFRKKSHFDFSDITKTLYPKVNFKYWKDKDAELHGHTVNYKDITSVAGCPVSARLKSIFGENWQNIEISSGKYKKNGDEIIYKLNDIWHVIFSYEDEEIFEDFLTNNLHFRDQKQIEESLKLFNSFPVGYANLSLKAINNILPFLKKGFIYSEAVLLAKVPDIIEKKTYEENDNIIIQSVIDVINQNRKEKELIIIVNSLISKHYNEFHLKKAKGLDDNIRTIAEKEVNRIVENHYGNKNWGKKDEAEKKTIIENVLKKYLTFLDGKQKPEEKASLSKVETDYYKMPHLSNQVKSFLLDNFYDFIIGTDEVEKRKRIGTLYHPSQVDIYEKQEGQIKLGSPKTASFKNPMAYKALYRLRDAINHLIDIGKINSDTKIVIEVARELNDKNMRWAIDYYQKKREQENQKYAQAIEELINEPDFKGQANPQSDSDIRKFRLWVEQLSADEEIEENKTNTISKKDIDKYRLWKEQHAICLYTGKPIKITDLFDSNIIDFEHTIPRSKSFDNSMANLTVCYANYNRNIKKNKIPTELDNYTDDWNGYTAIKPRLQAWENRVNELEKQINNLKIKSRTAVDKENKDYAIKQRHLKTFEYNYWKDKLDRFTRTDIPNGFVRSQLTDTQLITKYAYHYLKTVFNKVEVQKGSITSEFRKIYGIQEQNKTKDRTKHHHHAIDAAVLTLIPDSSKREEILKKAYEYEETKKGQYPENPFKGFIYQILKDIEKNILINNIADKDKALKETVKRVRKRGKVVWLKDKNGNLILDNSGNKIAKIAKGTTIRGQLHEDTFYGLIKVVKRENDQPLRDTQGNWIYEEKNQGLRFVVRLPIEKITDLKKIVDPNIAKMIREQQNGRTLKETIADGVFMLDKNGNKVNRIRRVRCWVRNTNLLKIKEQTYRSKHEHKRYFYADTGDNYAFGLYTDNTDYYKANKKIISRNLYEVSEIKRELKQINTEDLFEKYIEIGRGKNKKTAKLYHVFRPGQKVLFYEDNREELKEIENLSSRLYFIKLLFDAKQGLIQFQHHLEARNDEQLSKDFPKNDFGAKGKNGFSRFSTDFVQPRLLLSPGNLTCIIENKHFKMTLDGEIKFLF